MNVISTLCLRGTGDSVCFSVLMQLGLDVSLITDVDCLMRGGPAVGCG
jgi:hypothetical protein